MAEGLHRFLSFLHSLDSHKFKTQVVDDYLSKHRLTEDDFSDYSHFRQDGYGRNLVEKNKNFELLVLTWLPDQRTPIHDHAGQRCWMVLLAGELYFRNYEYPKLGASLVPLGKGETHRAPVAAYIDDSIGVHSINNASSQKAMSVHLYAGPIPRCQIYNEVTRRLEWTELSYHTRP